MEKLVWSIEANNDLIEIYNYISNDSSYYASKTVYDIIKKTRNLYNFPYMGRKCLFYNDEKYRELIIRLKSQQFIFIECGILPEKSAIYF